MPNENKDAGEWDELLKEHRQLMKQVADFCAWVEEVEQLGLPHFQEMGDRLTALRDALKTHFADEEAGGYLAAALEVAPRFCTEAEVLEAQHPTMLATLDELIEKLQCSPSKFESWQSATKEFNDFLGQFRQHESRENTIAQSAFGCDIGGVD